MRAAGRQRGQRRLAAGPDGAHAGGEVGAGHAHQRRPQHDVGVAQLELVDAAAHDGEGLQQQPQASPVGCAFGRRRDVDRDHHLGAHLARKAHRHGRHEPAVDVLAVPMRTGWNTAGTALDARTAVPVSPRWNSMPGAAVQVGGDDAQRRGICSMVRPPVCSRT
jgi:hypothetical protein